jgi:NitT/TauT family transport system ATP-binding protein
MRRIVHVAIPRPRSFGLNTHLDEVAACSAQLHDLLLSNETEPTVVPVDTGLPATLR